MDVVRLSGKDVEMLLDQPEVFRTLGTQSDHVHQTERGVAHAVHEHGAQSNGPAIVMRDDMGSIQPPLVEREGKDFPLHPKINDMFRVF